MIAIDSKKPGAGGSVPSTSTSVTVCVRIRPRNNKEREENMPVCFAPSDDNETVDECDPDGNVVKRWPYDYIFGDNADNGYIFEQVGTKLVDAALEGYNTVMFMYGQTSSGKTFTLFGDDKVSGLVQYTMERVYNLTRNSQDTEYVIKLTYAELYNEELKDLLAPIPSENNNLKIVEDPITGPSIQNITEAIFTNATEMKRLLDEGESKRHFGVTNMNAHSSRSHVIVRLHIESRKVASKLISSEGSLRLSWGKDKPSCISTLNLVDLAGSERSNKSGTSGQSLKEGSFINKSLLTLGTVISNLSEGKSGQHIPYRNSKLTRLLASALGGNAKTAMITCISPASGNTVESLSTLRFAGRAKKIVNKVKKNEILDAKALNTKLMQQSLELESLKNKLETMGTIDNDEYSIIRQKSIAASKNWKSLRYFLTHESSITMAFKKAGLTMLAKKVKQDIKSVIAGTKSITDVIEENISSLNNHVTNESHLISRLSEFMKKCDDEEYLISDIADIATSNNNDDEQPEVVMANDIEIEEKLEEIENLRMFTENYRTSFVGHIIMMEAEMRSKDNDRKKLNNDNSELMKKLEELTQIIQMKTEVEAKLMLQLNDQERNFKADISNKDKELAKSQKINVDLDSDINDKINTIKEMKSIIEANDNKIDSLISNCQLLSKDLNNTNTSKRLLEEESARIRADMTERMHKLRTNMHSLLNREESDSKVIESQITQITIELDATKHSLSLIERSHEKSLQEIEKLRQRLELKMSDEKKHMYKLDAANDEINDNKKTIRKMKQDIAELNGSNNALDKSNAQLRQELHQYKMINDDNSIKSIQKYDELDIEYKQYKNSNHHEKNELLSEIATLTISNQQKQEQLSKHEIKYNTDTTALKRKIDELTKSYEEKITNSNIEISKEKDATIALKRQVLSLLEDNNQLKITLHDVNTYIDSLMVVDDSNIKATIIDNYNTTTVSTASAASLSSSRLNTAELVETNEYRIDDTDQLLTNFNQSYSAFAVAMTTLTHLTQHVLSEEKLLRTFTNSMATREGQRASSYFISNDSLLKDQEILSSRTSHYQETIASLNEERDSYLDKIEMLERALAQKTSNYNELQLDNNSLEENMKLLSNKLELLQRKEDKYKLKIDMISIENKKLDDEKKNIMMRLEFETEKSLRLISKMDLVKQEKSVILAERDELCKRFGVSTSSLSLVFD